MKILVIGLGRFGKSFAIKAARYGGEVVAVDIDEKLVEEVEPYVADAKILDATDINALREIDPASVDYIVVSIGENLTASILAVVNLKELDIEHIIAKANSEIHAKVLEKVGADEIIYPEDESAERLAMKLTHKGMLEYFELFKNLSVAEITPPGDVIGKSLKESRIRNKYHVYVIAIKRGDEIITLPKPDEVIRQDDTIVVMGKPEDLEKIKS